MSYLHHRLSWLVAPCAVEVEVLSIATGKFMAGNSSDGLHHSIFWDWARYAAAIAPWTDTDTI